MKMSIGKYRRCFAWLPTRLGNSEWVWLTRYHKLTEGIHTWFHVKDIDTFLKISPADFLMYSLQEKIVDGVLQEHVTAAEFMEALSVLRETDNKNIRKGLSDAKFYRFDSRYINPWRRQR